MRNTRTSKTSDFGFGCSAGFNIPEDRKFIMAEGTGIKYVSVRHEAIAAFAADGYARVTCPRTRKVPQSVRRNNGREIEEGWKKI
ncbi:MAG: hypothetical protein LBQ90_08520 [Synergistaceae bacterium]|jgi:hypothetical protein|nr:hypothetical protein [Synergistaceae bacterium]